MQRSAASWLWVTLVLLFLIAAVWIPWPWQGSTEPLDPPTPPSSVAHAETPSLHGRMLHADGKPAAGLAYWVAWGAAPPKREGVTSKPIGLTPRNAARTDSEGRWRIPLSKKHERGLILCAVVADVRVAFLVTARIAREELHLPEVASVRVRMEGLRDRDRWCLIAWPATVDTAGPERRPGGAPPTADDMSFGKRLVQLPVGAGRPGRPVCHVLCWRHQPDLQAADCTIHTLAGAYQVLDLAGEGFLVEKPGDRLLARAPQELEVRVGQRIPTAEVRVVEAEADVLTRLHGRIWVTRDVDSSDSFPLVSGLGRLGYVGLVPEKGYPLVALMDDCEIFESVLRIPKAAHRHDVTFRRTLGKRPVRVLAGERRTFERSDGLVFEGRDQEMFKSTVGHQEFKDMRIHAHELTEDGSTLLLQEPRPWKRLWVIQPNGVVAVADSVPRVREIACRWLPMRKLPAVELRSLAARHGFGEQARFWYEVQLTNSLGRRSWQVVEQFPFGRPCALLSEEEPTWRMQVPVGWAHRVRIQGGGRKMELQLDR